MIPDWVKREHHRIAADRHADRIYTTALTQIYGDPTRPGSGIDLSHPDAPRQVEAVLAGAMSALVAVGGAE